MTELFETGRSESGQTGLDFPEPLSTKYTPKRVEDFLCQRPRLIMSRFCANPKPDAFYFVGPSGLGKTEMALAMARQIPAELHHMASRECTLETVQDMARKCHWMPRMANDWMPCKFHLVLVDEAHLMSPPAREAWLSKLDGTGKPPNTIFVLTGNDLPNDPHGALMSRLKKIEFSSYGLRDEIIKALERIWLLESGGKLKAPNFARLAKDANNNIRDAINSLELELMAAEPVEATIPASGMVPELVAA